MRFVLDASLTLAWFFEDESTSETDALQDRMADGAQVLCPPHWPVEIASGLAIAERRKRIPEGRISHFLGMLSQFFILVEPGALVQINGLVSLAREHGLTPYDAAYLELAMRTGLALGTLDEALGCAAKRVGIDVIPVIPENKS